MDSDDDRGADGISGAAPAVAASTWETSAAGVFAAEVPVAEVPVAGVPGAGTGDSEAPVVVGG
ncbi:hypothetical protein ACFU5L_14735, partial [Streptomyces sp. NPDC057509]